MVNPEIGASWCDLGCLPLACGFPASSNYIVGVLVRGTGCAFIFRGYLTHSVLEAVFMQAKSVFHSVRPKITWILGRLTISV